jgi:DNA mismatch repair protein MutS
MSEKVTPIRRQYLDIKSQYPDSIVFFRLGDFYETFDQDAEITSRELDIVLTSRNVAKGNRIPMAGIPYHAAENYLSRLIEKGYHVAICEQVGPVPKKGLVERKVVRVVTPGTIDEPGLLRSDHNNYLVAVYIEDKKAGIAYADITTGEFSATELRGDEIELLVRGEIMRLHPAEILVPEDLHLNGDLPGHISTWADWHYENNRCEQALKTHFNVAALDGFGLAHMSLATRAAGATLQYIEESQPAARKLLTSLSTYSLNDFMTLDAVTRRNLELTETIRYGEVRGSLLHILDQTVSPMGKRLMRQWVSKPLLDINTINARQDAVTYLLEHGILRAELRDSLNDLADLERLTNRVISGNALPRDLVAIRYTLQILPGIKIMLEDENSPLQDVLKDLHLCTSELSLLQAAIAEDPPATLQKVGCIRNGFSPELDQVYESSRHARQWIANLEAVERERTGIKNLKVGYNKVFGYYIEITRSNTELAPDDYIRKQTLVNAERYITPEMKEYESLVLNAEERMREIEGRVFRDVCNQFASGSAYVLKTARSLAQLDTLAALAESAAINAYVRPNLLDDTTLDIRDGRHPVVEHYLKDTRFVTNDAIFGTGEIVRIITGPNMSGKSTFLRQVALIVLMAQMGSFVPAESANIGLVDRIFTRIGAQDEIHSGQSTFMVEMIETANILNHATERSLLILDEIGRGTSTYDGVSIAWATVEYVHNHPGLHARTLFATHYHELTQLSDLLPGIRNYNVAVTESDGKVVFLHKIVPGGSDRSYGIHVAQLAGMPQPVIQRASQILEQLEASSGTAVNINPLASAQLTLFPETNPLLEELGEMDVNTLSPIEALNKLYEWQKKFGEN